MISDARFLELVYAHREAKERWMELAGAARELEDQGISAEKELDGKARHGLFERELHRGRVASDTRRVISESEEVRRAADTWRARTMEAARSLYEEEMPTGEWVRVLPFARSGPGEKAGAVGVYLRVEEGKPQLHERPWNAIEDAPPYATPETVDRTIELIEDLRYARWIRTEMTVVLVIFFVCWLGTFGLYLSPISLSIIQWLAILTPGLLMALGALACGSNLEKASNEVDRLKQELEAY